MKYKNKYDVAKGEFRQRKSLKKVMILSDKNTNRVTDYLSELPLGKTYKITIEEV